MGITTAPSFGAEDAESTPRPEVGVAGLEFWVADLGRARTLFADRFHFRAVPAPADEPPAVDAEVAHLAAGTVRLVLRKGTSPVGVVGRHVAAHGDTVADIALSCADPAGIASRAAACGLLVTGPANRPTIDVLGDGTIRHTMSARSAGWAPDIAVGTGPERIDHVAYCLPWGLADRLGEIYERVFALSRIDADSFESVGGRETGMRSVVLRSTGGGFTVVLTEPAVRGGVGQTQRFVDAHGGPGVQHVALAYSDLVGAVESLRQAGVEFLPVPVGYYEQARRRLGDRPVPWNDLSRLGILADADDNGLLFQLFTRPLTDRDTFFIELIQRSGANGFGANNVRALFDAVEATATDRREGASTVTPSASGLVGSCELPDLVHRARATIPFYQHHLEAADPTAIPTFDKHATAGYGPFPLTAGGPAGAHRVVATSGTTGDRLYLAFDREDHDRVRRWLEIVGRRAGLLPTDVLLNTHCYGLWVGGPVLNLLADGAGACVVPLGPGPAAGVLHMLQAGVGTAISATPSYLRRLIEAAEAVDFNLSATGLRLGFIGAEPAEPALRRNLLSRLPRNFQWIELYGLTETLGPSVAFGADPDLAELELNTDDFHVEVLHREADEPVALGEIGELTLTGRHPCRSPLIRYRTRDLVRVLYGAPENPTRISTILGRADDALKIGGVLTYPTAVAEIVTGLLPPTAEWRAIVRRHDADDDLLIEAEAPPERCSRIERAFDERIGLAVTVLPTDGSTITRSLAKTRRFSIERTSDQASLTVRRSTCG